MLAQRNHIGLLRSCAAAGLFLLFAGADAPARAGERRIAQGVTLSQEITSGADPLVISVITVDLHAPGVSLQDGQARDAISLEGPSSGREPVHALAMRNGAIAAINADFFPFTGDPLSLAIRNGELLSEPIGYRACFGMGRAGPRIGILTYTAPLRTQDGALLSVSGINRVPHNDDIIALTPAYRGTPRMEKRALLVTVRAESLPVRVGREVRGQVTAISTVEPGSRLPLCNEGSVVLAGVGAGADSLAAHCVQGDTLSFQFNLYAAAPSASRGQLASRGQPAGESTWSDVEQAVGGGPILVANGQIALDGEAERFDVGQFIAKRHGRSALGIRSDGTLLMVAVDGRQQQSRGVSLMELAAIMKRLGARSAINFDGGGSTTLWAAGCVVNAPSDGRERPIADALLVKAPLLEAENPFDAHIIPVGGPPDVIAAGQSMRFRLVDAQGLPVQSPDAIWGTIDGFGWVSQSGVFRSQRAGKGMIACTVAGRQVVLPVTVAPAAAEVLKASVTAAPNDPPDRNSVTVRVLDHWSNPVRGITLRVEIGGGEVAGPLITDIAGHATAEIQWSVPVGARSLVISTGTLRAVLLEKKP